MKKLMYCYRDVKSSFYAPMEYPNDEVAKRDFSYTLHNNHLMGFAPFDYDLYFVGEFDSDNGHFISADPIRFVCSGREVFSSEE